METTKNESNKSTNRQAVFVLEESKKGRLGAKIIFDLNLTEEPCDPFLFGELISLLREIKEMYKLSLSKNI